MILPVNYVKYGGYPLLESLISEVSWHMIIEYCRTKSYNFGDDLNPWLWPRLLGDELLSKDDGTRLIGIGTLLTHKRLHVQLKNAKELIIFSSGTWDDRAPALPAKCRVYGVRGPRTAKRLGLSADKAIGDGAC